MKNYIYIIPFLVLLSVITWIYFIQKQRKGYALKAKDKILLILLSIIAILSFLLISFLEINR